MEQPQVNGMRETGDERHAEPVSMSDLPVAVGCILDDVAQIRSKVEELWRNLGIGAAGTKPVTVKEAAEFLSVTERAVNKMVRERQIPYYERHGKIYFFEKELLEWIRKSRVATFDEEISNYTTRRRRL